MQSDYPNVYQVIERPESLGLEYLYSTMEDAYRAAKPSKYSRYDREVHITEINKVKKYYQQEFLSCQSLTFVI